MYGRLDFISSKLYGLALNEYKPGNKKRRPIATVNQMQCRFNLYCNASSEC